MKDWRRQHGAVMVSFIRFLYSQTDNFVFKGGTALYLCYHLDRFSEDIDLDGRERTLVDLVTGFCGKNGYAFRIAKDTDTVQRCMIYYGSERKPLKIEASYRRRDISAEETSRLNGILVYNIEALCVMKISAYAGRDRIRDLYDLTFICNNYFDQLSPQTKSLMRNAVEHKGIEQFDYIVREQSDELIDTVKLAEDFLGMYDLLGLLYDEHERDLITVAAADVESKLEDDEDDWEDEM